jgi:hypothetical protein
LLDTGSPISLDKPEIEPHLVGGKRTKIRCSGATGDSLGMRQVGRKIMHVVDNIEGGGGETTIQTETHTATNLSKTLLSIADLYEGGEWDLLLRGEKRA